MEKVMRVGLYARVSKREGQDTENQLRQLREFAATQGWRVVAEYVDEITGKHSDRAAFRRLYADASKRAFDVVLFWSLDRFSREGVRETLNHLQTLTHYGVAWRSFTEQWLDSLGPWADMVLSVLATVAKQERIRISERTIAGLQRARAAGRVGGRPKLVVDRAAAKELRKNGASHSAIAHHFGISKSSAARLTAE
jgi:DNA invertase Pin-like site-specific DNA recombinase